MAKNWMANENEWTYQRQLPSDIPDWLRSQYSWLEDDSGSGRWTRQASNLLDSQGRSVIQVGPNGQNVYQDEGFLKDPNAYWADNDLGNVTLADNFDGSQGRGRRAGRSRTALSLAGAALGAGALGLFPGQTGGLFGGGSLGAAGAGEAGGGVFQGGVGGLGGAVEGSEMVGNAIGNGTLGGTAALESAGLGGAGAAGAGALPGAATTPWYQGLLDRGLNAVTNNPLGAASTLMQGAGLVGGLLGGGRGGGSSGGSTFRPTGGLLGGGGQQAGAFKPNAVMAAQLQRLYGRNINGPV